MLRRLLAESDGHFWQPAEFEDVANPDFENLKHLQNPGHLSLTAPSMTTNGTSGSVFVLGEIWICLTCLLVPSSWSVAMCDDFIFLPSGSLAVISFDIITGDIVVVAFFY